MLNNVNPFFPPDTSLRDGLFHEYKRFGKVMSVTLKGEKEDRIAVVTFKKADDAAKAYQQSIERVFFGKKIQCEQHSGFNQSDEDFKPPEAELDEYHHKSTRTLFVGNLDTQIEADTLREVFRHYGHILVRAERLFLSFLYSSAVPVGQFIALT